MTTFQRARSEEQREERRQAILTTAAAMLAEMPVAAAEPQRAEPPRRPGQVERAALLRDPRGGAAGAARHRLAGVAGAARRRACRRASTPTRRRVARGTSRWPATLTASLVGRPVAVRADQRVGGGAGTQRLPEVARRYKLTSIANLDRMAALLMLVAARTRQRRRLAGRRRHPAVGLRDLAADQPDRSHAVRLRGSGSPRCASNSRRRWKRRCRSSSPAAWPGGRPNSPRS